METELFIRFNLPGIHHWPAAPEHLHFIKHPHRHNFHFEITCQVTDLDRELEFFEVQAKATGIVMESYDYNDLVIDFGTNSCEQIATNLLQDLPDFVTCVSVSEDEENGARVWR